MGRRVGDAQCRGAGPSRASAEAQSGDRRLDGDYQACTPRWPTVSCAPPPRPRIGRGARRVRGRAPRQRLNIDRVRIGDRAGSRAHRGTRWKSPCSRAPSIVRTHPRARRRGPHGRRQRTPGRVPLWVAIRQRGDTASRVRSRASSTSTHIGQAKRGAARSAWRRWEGRRAGGASQVHDADLEIPRRRRARPDMAGTEATPRQAEPTPSLFKRPRAPRRATLACLCHLAPLLLANPSPAACHGSRSPCAAAENALDG